MQNDTVFYFRLKLNRINFSIGSFNRMVYFSNRNWHFTHNNLEMINQKIP